MITRNKHVPYRPAWCLCLLLLFLPALHSSATAQALGWPRGSTTNTLNKIKASPLIADLNHDGQSEIIVPSFDGKLYVYRHDGLSYGANWPVSLNFTDGTMSSPAVGDVDGDGNDDIVVAGDDTSGHNAKVAVYKADGTLISNIALTNNTNASGKATPCLIDCYCFNNSTAHPAKDILIRDGDGNLQVFYWNGSSFTNLFLDISLYHTTTDTLQMDRSNAQQITASVAAYTTGTGQTYIVTGSVNQRIYRWKAVSKTGTGNNWTLTALPSFFPAVASNTRYYSSVSLADINGDSFPDIIVGGSDGAMNVLNGLTGADLSGWPQAALQGFFSSPCVADLDQNGNKEIIAGNNDGNVYVWSAGGSLRTGWPQATQGEVFGSPVAGQLDGTAGLEIVASSLDGYLYAWHADGTAVDGWPKRIGSPLYASPALGDIHQSTRMSIVCGSLDGSLVVFDMPHRSLSLTAGWLQFRAGPLRQGH